MSAHTSGKWRAVAYASHAKTSILSDAPLPKEIGGQKVLPGPFVIAECNCSFDSAQDEANAARIAPCVNAFDGMPQKDVEELAAIPGGVMALTIQADDYRLQRDALRAEVAATARLHGEALRDRDRLREENRTQYDDIANLTRALVAVRERCQGVHTTDQVTGQTFAARIDKLLETKS